MPIHPTDLISLAKKQRSAVAESDEAELRCCASRVYYGALHLVDATFDEAGRKVNGRDQGTHEAVFAKAHAASRKGGRGSIDAAEIFNLMPRIKRLRVKADYHLEASFDERDVKEAFQASEKVQRLCASITFQRGRSASAAKEVAMTVDSSQATPEARPISLPDDENGANPAVQTAAPEPARPTVVTLKRIK